MKKLDFERCMTILRTSDILRNDGAGNVFVYDEQRGVCQQLRPIRARQCIEAILRKNKVFLPTRELRELHSNVAERLEFFDDRLKVYQASVLIACENGILDLSTGKLQAFDKKILIRNFLRFRFLEDARLTQESRTYQFIKTLLGVKSGPLEASPKYHLFMEVLGYAISNLRPVKKAFILLGPPSIGKSVVLELIGRIVGEDAYTSASWATLVEKYYSALVVGATLVLSDEMPAKPLRHLDVLKSIISGSSIVVEKKFGDILKYTPHVKLISAANCLPELGEPDAGGAFAERLIILRLGLDTPVERDPDLIDALWEERDILFSLAVKETKLLIERKMSFTADPDGQVLCEQLRNSGNSVNSYIQSRYQRDPNGRICIEDCYADYINFCEEEFWRAIAKADFRRQLAQLGYSFRKLRVQGHSNARYCIVGLTAREGEYECPHPAKSPQILAQSESQS